MHSSNTVVWLAGLIVVLALAAAGIGLFWQDGGSPFTITTLRGETVQLYGQGVYRYETFRDGAGFKGVDVYTLVAAIPLLVVCTVLYHRGSLRGGLLLTGTLAYFLYNSTSMTFGYAYNNLFLLYLAQFTASLFATVLAFASFDARALPMHFTENLPRRGIAAFLFVIGAALLGVWLGLDILPALLGGGAPALATHTTLPTHALDMGVIAPLALLAGFMLLRRQPWGCLLASVMLGTSSVLGGGVIALSAAQLLAGALTVGQTLGFVVPFVLLTVFAIGFLGILLRNMKHAAQLPPAKLRAAHAGAAGA